MPVRAALIYRRAHRDRTWFILVLRLGIEKQAFLLARNLGCRTLNKWVQQGAGMILMPS